MDGIGGWRPRIGEQVGCRVGRGLRWRKAKVGRGKRGIRQIMLEDQGRIDVWQSEGISCLVVIRKCLRVEGRDCLLLFGGKMNYLYFLMIMQIY